MKFKNILTLVLCALALACAGCVPKSPETLAKERRANIDAVVARAQTMMFEEKLAEAQDILKKAYETYGSDLKICETLAYAYSQDNQPALAAVYFEKASAESGADSVLMLNAAKAYERANALESAEKMYKKYLAREHKDFLAWKSLAAVYENSSRFNEALEARFSALKVAGRNPNTAEACAIGLLFVKLGNKTQALRWLEPALKASSEENVQTRTQILCALIDIYLSDKNMPALEGAIAELEKINPQTLQQQYPELKKQLDDFKKKLDEAKAALESEKQKKIQEELAAKKAAEEKAKAEAEKKKLEEQKRLEQEKKAAEEEAAKRAAEAGKKDGGKTAGQGNAQAPVENEAAEIKDVSTPVSAQDFIKKTYEDIEAKDYKAAAKNAHKAVSKDYGSYETWKALAKAYEADGKKTDAYLAARESLLRNPDDLDSNLYFLRCAAKVVPNYRLIDRLFEAHTKFPSNSEILLGLARAYAIEKKPNNAMHFYRRFLEASAPDNPWREDAARELAELESGKLPQAPAGGGENKVEIPDLSKDRADTKVEPSPQKDISEGFGAGNEQFSTAPQN